LCIGIIEDFKKSISQNASFTVEDIDAFETRWHKRELFLHLGVNSRYIDTISESIVQLKAAVKTESEEEITSSLDMLIFRLGELEKLNRFSLSNVF
jgi:hypothetical protein